MHGERSQLLYVKLRGIKLTLILRELLKFNCIYISGNFAVLMLNYYVYLYLYI